MNLNCYDLDKTLGAGRQKIPEGGREKEGAGGGRRPYRNEHIFCSMKKVRNKLAEELEQIRRNDLTLSAQQDIAVKKYINLLKKGVTL